MASEWLEDAFGPDGIRVTLCVEPAVERWVRERDAWTTPKYTLFPDPIRIAIRRLLPEVAQRVLFKDRWAIVVEADSGERRRLIRDTHDAALETARAIRKQVHDRGIAALADTDATAARGRQ